MLGASFERPSNADHVFAGFCSTNANISWVKETFPKDIEEILIGVKYNENKVNDEKDESDNGGDTF